MHLYDCKTCKHATVLYTKTKDGRFTELTGPSNYVMCGKPSYRGRKYFIVEKKECPAFERREKPKAME